MNNEMIFFGLFGLLCVTFGYFGRVTYLLIHGIFETKRRRQEYPYYEEAHEGKICSGPHQWSEINLALGKIVGVTKVCSECGFISGYGGDYKLNAPAMAVFKNEMLRRERRKKVDQELIFERQRLVQEAMNRVVKENVEKFQGDLHYNVEQLQQFFRVSMIELESVYAKLKKDLDRMENDG